MAADQNAIFKKPTTARKVMSNMALTLVKSDCKGREGAKAENGARSRAQSRLRGDEQTSPRSPLIISCLETSIVFPKRANGGYGTTAAA